jgi:Transmembrane proteins 14C
MQESSHILYFYGAFLILCGIISVIFIGMKAKTALASGGISGILSITTAYMIIHGYDSLMLPGILLSLALFCVFAWRSTKTLHTIFTLIPSQHSDLPGKGIAFLIISLMAVVSLIVTMLQILNCAKVT